VRQFTQLDPVPPQTKRLDRRFGPEQQAATGWQSFWLWQSGYWQLPAMHAAPPMASLQQVWPGGQSSGPSQVRTGFPRQLSDAVQKGAGILRQQTCPAMAQNELPQLM
jgi:hypothetical protein